MSLSEDLGKSNIMLVITSKEKYRDSIQDILRETDKVSEKIGYISINKPFNSIQDILKGAGINSEKFFFVDAITATVKSPPIVTNCIFVSSPNALTEISMAFTALLNEKGCTVILFDTISTLVIYQDIGSVTKFVHNLVTKASISGKKAIFIALKEDSEVFIKDLNMFVDKITEI